MWKPYIHCWLRKMRVCSYILVSLVVLFLCLKLRLVGISYPEIVENQPLESPIRVIRIEGNNVELADGRTLSLNDPSHESWSDVLAQSENMIDVEEFDSDFVAVYARQDGWVCGTPWAQPIRIPLIRDTVYKNRRELVGIGKVSKGSSQQGAPPEAYKPRR